MNYVILLICILFRKLRNNKVEIDRETAYKGLSQFEKKFADNRPDYKCLAEKAHSLMLHTALVKRANCELHSILSAYNRCANEEIHKLKEYFIDTIIEDSGVGVSYNDNDESSSSVDSMKYNE